MDLSALDISDILVLIALVEILVGEASNVGEKVEVRLLLLPIEFEISSLSIEGDIV